MSPLDLDLPSNACLFAKELAYRVGGECDTRIVLESGYIEPRIYKYTTVYYYR